MKIDKFGEKLSQGLRSVANKQDRDVQHIENEVARNLGYTPYNIQRWRQGHVPKEPHIEFLVRYCSSEGYVDREWAQELLHHARYFGSEKLLQQLFPDESQRTNKPISYHNLPSIPNIIGREMELERAIEGLDSRWPIVSIEGIAGAGKTALATVIGYCCLGQHEFTYNRPFEAVVWVSAKDNLDQKRWLNDILNQIAIVLRSYSSIGYPIERKKDEVNNLLRIRRTLIIIDNFDTIDDPDLVAWMYQVPEPSKVLLTSRPGEFLRSWMVELEGLSDEYALEHIGKLARARNLPRIEHADTNILIPLVRATAGNPKIIEMALGHVKYGSTIDKVVDDIFKGEKSVDDIFDYMVVGNWQVLSPDERHSLMAATFFMDVTQDALAFVVEMTNERIEVTLKRLVEMSLLDMQEELKREERRYSLHPIIRAFVQAQLQEHQTWASTARQRWVTYYLNFLDKRVQREKITGSYWQYLGGGRLMSIRPEWPNLLNVLEWANTHKQHQVLINLMMRLVHYMDRRAYYPLRLTYARKAAEAASILDQPDVEALFLIDAMGVTLRKTGRYDEAIQVIQTGLKLLEKLDPTDSAVINLKVVGYTFLAKTYIEMSNFIEAAKWIAQSMVSEQVCTPVIRHRVLVTAGDLAHEKQDFKEATKHYQEALDMVCIYSMEGDTDMAGVQRKLGVNYLALGKIDHAEREFEEVVAYTGQGGMLNDIQAKFGLAQVLEKRGQEAQACELVLEARQALSQVSLEHPLLKTMDDFIEHLQREEHRPSLSRLARKITRKNVYISPHLDDAALSCAGLIALQVARGEHVQIVNLFAGIPDFEEDQFSPYAQKQHKKWDLKPQEAVRARRREDQHVFADLGAEVDHWSYYDAIYRAVDNVYFYTDHQKLFGPIHQAEYQLIDGLAERLLKVYQDSPTTVFYAPLWVGGHVDHLIARECAVKLIDWGATIVFYEDFPYVARENWPDEPNTVEKAIAKLPFRVESELVHIDAKSKIQALMGYKSQLMSLFGDWEGVGLAHEVHTYTAKVGRESGFQEHSYFERYWHPVQS